MPVELVYHVKQGETAGPFRELDDVRVMVDVVTLDGDRIRAGAEGTVVAVWNGGEAYEVEFPQPMGALATVESADLVRVGRPVPWTEIPSIRSSRFRMLSLSIIC